LLKNATKLNFKNFGLPLWSSLAGKQQLNFSSIFNVKFAAAALDIVISCECIPPSLLPISIHQHTHTHTHMSQLNCVAFALLCAHKNFNLAKKGNAFKINISNLIKRRFSEWLSEERGGGKWRWKWVEFYFFPNVAVSANIIQ